MRTYIILLVTTVCISTSVLGIQKDSTENARKNKLGIMVFSANSFYKLSPNYNANPTFYFEYQRYLTPNKDIFIGMGSIIKKKSSFRYSYRLINLGLKNYISNSRNKSLDIKMQYAKHYYLPGFARSFVVPEMDIYSIFIGYSYSKDIMKSGFGFECNFYLGTSAYYIPNDWMFKKLAFPFTEDHKMMSSPFNNISKKEISITSLGHTEFFNYPTFLYPLSGQLFLTLYKKF
jgi:hypothetical protein